MHPRMRPTTRIKQHSPIWVVVLRRFWPSITRGVLLREQSPLRYMQGQTLCRKPRAHPYLPPGGVARVCGRYAHIRIPTIGRQDPSLRKHLLYDLKVWIRTEGRRKNTHSPTRHPGQQTEPQGVYSTHCTPRQGARLYQTKCSLQGRKAHELSCSQDEENMYLGIEPCWVVMKKINVRMYLWVN